MSGPEKGIEAVGLELVAKGLTEALGELNEIGSVGLAGQGRGFSELALSSMDLGHGGLTAAMSSFCERWEWGVRSLIDEGNTFAGAVGLSAGTFYETDQYVDGAFKVAVNAATGNPFASEDEVTGMSWDELRANDARANPDYSRDSFEEALANSEQGWLDAQRDVLTSDVVSPVPAQEATGLGDAEYEALLDEQFGPSAQDRAETAERQAQGEEPGPHGNAIG